MLQLTQELKSGKMSILRVSTPANSKGHILIKNHFSIISAGTEGKSVKDARLGYIGKAKSRKKEVKQVINLVKTQGLVPTYQMVMNKLESPSPLGYSCAGEVIGVGDGVVNFKVGDYVSCGGASAVHAEFVSVPKNLCAKIPTGVNLKYAAFATIASIAMQGIRQADLRIGENCVIIGLGLIGQLTIQMLNAAGVQTFGIDIEQRPVELAIKSGATLALLRNQADLEQIILDATQGFGTDSVIITAGSSSLDPVELAGILCRKKGKVIIVGAVPTGFSREHFYKKELELKMSSSYGPGRYDPQYEEKGIDYPIGYVRWTENRNMQAYLQLLKDKKLNIDFLISHEFNFENAPKAYQIIVDKSEPFTGIVLKYDIDKPLAEKVEFLHKDIKKSDVNIGFIGAGSFAKNFLLPNAKKWGKMVGVATAHGHTSRNAADKYGFTYATGEASEIIADDNINTVFIATRHNYHAEFVMKSLQAGKNVFVEKPLALNETELEEIRNIYLKQSSVSATVPRIMVGFNRRFSPYIVKLKEQLFDKSTKAINYRINAGKLPQDHWVQDPEIGGGRIIGEVCHFVDLCRYLADSPVYSISATAMEDPQALLDSLIVNMMFKNGSVASLSYFSNGNKLLNKEYLEVYSAGQVVSIDDFKEMTVWGKKKTKFKFGSDKGHAEEVRLFLHSIKEGQSSPIPFEQLYESSLIPFKIIESIKNRKVIILS